MAVMLALASRTRSTPATPVVEDVFAVTVGATVAEPAVTAVLAAPIRTPYPVVTAAER
ncbi:hypothetical protein [Streptomyces beihaiensis]|uniref:Secreted protein n=1 Tax=Streptomyces beihaiensis TaxID=2984495 RepID=A0ABT3U4I5_9ACTN|nr:hypothetical protein [Streptomyces beihaiensis]MCX3064199.1 hypothetical protein [Streptomyces beihaiensis]